MRALRLSSGLFRVGAPVLGVCATLVSACSSGSTGSVGPNGSIIGASEFSSAPQLGQTPAGAWGLTPSAAGGDLAGSGGDSGTGGGGTTSGSGGSPSAGTGGSTTRTVQETDLYAVEGDRLYYLNSYRGLMVFDIANADAPHFLGRSAIYGDPQAMTVENGICTVVIGDWYGVDTGSPFHGSIVRGLDAQDPTNIKVVGEAHIGGYVQDTRVVGNVLYLVTADYGWEYGWYDNYGYGTSSNPTVAVASVSFANGVIKKAGYQKLLGNGGVFSVTPNSILLATDVSQQQYDSAGLTNLQYVDISDPGGAIKMRGSIDVPGAVNGWGPDNGRWNLDFANGVTAHALGCVNEYCDSSGYVLQTVDFSNPDAPAVASSFSIPDQGWTVAARFNGTQLYLSPADGGYDGTGNSTSTPFSVYDLSNPKAPVLAGSAQLAGNPWLFLPEGHDLFSIGNSLSNDQQVQIQYLNVSNPNAPSVLGTTNFGSGWAWSPAASTFKAVTINSSLGFVVVPFSGWDDNSAQYTNGVQLVGFTPNGLTTSSTAFSKGWVQRGIFVGGRLYSISDEALAVVDYTNPAAPTVKSQLTLARNVVTAQPQGSTIAEVSSDWWGNDVNTSEMRVQPIADADQTTDNGVGVTTSIAGVGAQVFQNGTLSYVVTQVQHPAPCGVGWAWGDGSGSGCVAWSEQVQVVDTSNGGAKLRGKVTLPDTPNGWSGWGWGGFWYYDWYDGAEIVQVGGNALAFRRWYPTYGVAGSDGIYGWDDSLDALFVVDLSNPDAPSIASTTVTDDTTTWWGDMQAVGDTLYTSHYEWVNRPDPNNPNPQYNVRYYLDVVDLSDRSHPAIGQKINVPGQLVGASTTDPSVLYTVDYWWGDDGNARNNLDVVQVVGGQAFLQSKTELDGWVGQVFVQNDVAYTTVQQYDWSPDSFTELHQIDLTNPAKPVDRIATDRSSGWGWLLGVQGDRAVVTSGWGLMGYDIYKLSPNAAPAYEQSVRALGWGANGLTRQGNTLYMASGYWGVQTVSLQ